MTTESVKKALVEALGGVITSNKVWPQLEKRAKELGRDGLGLLDASKELLGTGVLNPNVEHQVRVRVAEFDKGVNKPIVPDVKPVNPDAHLKPLAAVVKGKDSVVPEGADAQDIGPNSNAAVGPVTGPAGGVGAANVGAAGAGSVGVGGGGNSGGGGGTGVNPAR